MQHDRHDGLLQAGADADGFAGSGDRAALLRDQLHATGANRKHERGQDIAARGGAGPSGGRCIACNVATLLTVWQLSLSSIS